MKIFLIVYFFALVFLNAKIYSQCSDAGVCVIGRHQVNEFVRAKNSIYFGYIYGSSGKDADINGSLNNLSYGSFRLEADIEISNGFRLNASIPYTFVSGPLGETNGLGDAEAVFSKVLAIKKKNLLSFFIGGKFSTGKVNSSDSLPQRYMPGQGSNDLIAGVQYTRENYYFAAGYQKPFGRSANTTTRLKRGDDVFFRAGFFEQFSKVGVKAEIITILRLQRSSVLLNRVPQETFIEVEGSNETQVSMLASAIFSPTEKFSVTGTAAIPFLKRNYNYDGLKRALTISVMLSYNF
jgi:hypothetical protein